LDNDRVEETPAIQAPSATVESGPTGNKSVGNEDADKLVLPLHGEALTVTRRKVETGRVHISTVTTTHDALVDELLAREQVEIERIPVGRVVETPPTVRNEGYTTIIPVVEDVVFVEKRIFLKEEVHIRRVRRTEHHRETVVLREQEAVIKRSEPPAPSGE
jgi:uncharacterized protein (TIGR02271 family)